ncbi:MAG: methionyl-tRNA formyltransferase, partial [Clostridia bacterium]|nr:methionyl-tRNA formyltransferase [Clostridia bacterium]
QNHTLATHAAKIEKPDCILDFSSDARELFNRIRGLSPFPLAFAVLNGKMVKFVSAEYSDKTYDILPGTVTSLDNGVVTISCGRGSLRLTGLLPEGKGRMSAADFIRGRKINVGDVFEKAELNK